MTRATLTLLFTLVLFVHITRAEAAHRLPLSRRTSTMQGSAAESSPSSANHAWKFALLGLAGLGFLIRKRL
jgi:MYXO-CTERM domain-containing protein